jgi:hypothetical protein
MLRSYLIIFGLLLGSCTLQTPQPALVTPPTTPPSDVVCPGIVYQIGLNAKITSGVTPVNLEVTRRYTALSSPAADACGTVQAQVVDVYAGTTRIARLEAGQTEFLWSPRAGADGLPTTPGSVQVQLYAVADPQSSQAPEAKSSIIPLVVQLP